MNQKSERPSKLLIKDFPADYFPYFEWRCPPFQEGFIQVSKIHKIHFEVSGNPKGKPVLILHGGPGGGSSPADRGLFDPKAYKLVQFDQRGCGKSTPSTCLEENTTWDLVADIEKIREVLLLPKWHTVTGGSWGATLALCYAIKHSNRVGHLNLRGIFTCRKSELSFLFQEGSSWFYPEYHEELRDHLPKEKQGDIIKGYYEILTSEERSQKEKLEAARKWSKYEMAISSLVESPEFIKEMERNEKFCIEFATIETHYFVNEGFFEKENYLLENMDKIKEIPTVITQGRYDMVCPPKTAWELYKKLDKCYIFMVPDGGHSAGDPGIADGVIRGSEIFKNDP